MKILYGVQATGNGHITRARALLPSLQQQGIEVDFLFSGRPKQRLFDMEMFKDYRWARGFTFATAKGKVNTLATLTQLQPWQFYRDVSQLDVSDYDLILTDFEPVTAWAAKRQGILSVGLARQYALRYPLAGQQSARWLKTAVSIFAPAKLMLGVHWCPEFPSLLPPLLAPVSPLPVDGSELPFILVYLPFEQLSAVVNWLKQCPSWHFKLYANVNALRTDDNVTILPLSRHAFPADLQRCRGVICNSGFGLCSEALVAGKKLLIKSLQGQIEQAYNTFTLLKMGKAQQFKTFSPEALLNWLYQPAAEPFPMPDPATAVARWLKQGCVDTVSDLAATIWQQQR
ncbi:glycosyltransferase family protein [Arsukibacterium sp.]|uniref:glycosyltransferase family protein n=1 Tax=Arsukibacterium sp. TaxID=1977258 RepID=UPI00299E2B98|nr:glycosyltransferase family protein [Arsukibacterium sp.]MDX1678172.1 glycosyltransferase family protein [Arsukibacterium sp.]